MVRRRLLILLSSSVMLIASMAVMQPAHSAPDDPTFDAVATGRDHTCALADGYVWCWGANDDGQLGSPTADPVVGDPVPVAGISTAVEITAGAAHTCARLEDGSARCWGANNVGQLGDGTTIDRRTPVQVVDLPAISQIAAGRSHTCAVTEATDELYCWGSNGSGQLGNGSVQDVQFGFSVLDPSEQMRGRNSVAVDPSGDVLVSDSAPIGNSRTIHRFDSDGGVLQRWAFSGETPNYVAFAAGVGYGSLGNSVYRLQDDGGTELVATYPTVLAGLAGDETGALYVAYELNSVVTVVKTGPAGWTRTFTTGSGISKVTDIALDPEDVLGGRRLYLATATSDYRVKFLSAATGSAQGSVLTLLPNGDPCSHFAGTAGDLPQPNAGARIGVSADGELLVSSHGRTGTGVAGCIDAYDRDGDHIDSFQPGLLSTWRWDSRYANDLAGTPDGGAVIVDVTGSRVRRLSTLAPTWGRDTTWGSLGFALHPRRVASLGEMTGNGVVAQVALGSQNTCAIVRIGQPSTPFLWCWGDNSSHQLSENDFDTTSWPGLDFAQPVDVAVGDGFWCAIPVGRASLTCNGVNVNGQLGGGTADGWTNTMTLTSPAGDPVAFTDVALGSMHGCASSADGYVRCWGGDPLQFGGAGDETVPGWVRTSDPAVSEDPTEDVGLLIGATQLSASARHSCVTQELGGVYCWGSNADALKNIIDRGVATTSAAPLTVNLGERVTAKDPSSLRGAMTVDFGAAVGNVRSSNVRVSGPDGTVTPQTAVACRDADGLDIACSSVSTWYADLTPDGPWLLGAPYTVSVNASGGPGVAMAGIPIPAQQIDVSAPALQQESQAGGTYSWPKTSAPVKRSFGRSFTWSRTPGATATYRFKGSTIAWVTARGPGEGSVAVSVDGKKYKVFRNTAKQAESKVVRTLSGLGRGAHVLRFKVVAKPGRPEVAGRVVIDAFRTKQGLVSSPRLQYTWAPRSNAAANGGAYVGSGDKGATLRVPFWGTSITAHSLTGPSQGSFRMRVGDARTVVRTHGPAGPMTSVHGTLDGLDPGRHVLIVEVLGKGPGKYDRVAIDALEAGDGQ